MEPIPEKKKRGRKAKIVNLLIPTDNVADKIPKKRGRKPKGGKVVTIQPSTEIEVDPKINIILHLKCNTNEIIHCDNNSKNNIDNFQFPETKSTELNFMIYNTKNEIINDIELTSSQKSYQTIGTPNTNSNTNTNTNTNTNANANTPNNNFHEHSSDTDNMKSIWYKLEKLSNNLHINNICDKKSACFHCTCNFDNSPIYRPKYELNKLYYVYGCFCSPECACAFLMNDKNIDSSARFERYQLLNFIYCKIYDYKKNIKPAPSPYYMLDKYYGNLTIQEYRKLLKNERLLLIVEKPLIRILPELHEDSEDYLLNYQGIPSATSNKFSLQKQNKQQTKNDILQDQFKVR